MVDALCKIGNEIHLEFASFERNTTGGNHAINLRPVARLGSLNYGLHVLAKTWASCASVHVQTLDHTKLRGRLERKLDQLDLFDV